MSKKASRGDRSLEDVLVRLKNRLELLAALIDEAAWDDTEIDSDARSAVVNLMESTAHDALGEIDFAHKLLTPEAARLRGVQP